MLRLKEFPCHQCMCTAAHHPPRLRWLLLLRGRCSAAVYSCSMSGSSLPCGCSLLLAAPACASSSAAAAATLTTGNRPRREDCPAWPCCCPALLLAAPAALCCTCCCSGDLGRAPPNSPATCGKLSALPRLAAEAPPGDPPGSSELRRELPPLLPALSLQRSRGTETRLHGVLYVMTPPD